MKKNIGIAALQLLFAFGSAVQAQTPLLPRDTEIKGPQTFAMIVGISNYKYVRPLAYADKDAQLFKDYLLSAGGGHIREENIFTLLNEKAVNSNFWGKGFQWLNAKKLQRGDRLFIYLAGHGDAIDEDQFFFLGQDCNPQGDKNNYLVAGTIQLFNLKKKIVNETAKGVEVFFIMDACRSNELPGGLEGQNFLNTAISEKNAGEIIMLATAAGEESLEDASIGNGHGLFTYYLVDGLTGEADSKNNPDHKITFREIEDYVDNNVPSVAAQRFKRKQDPYFCCTENAGRIISAVDTAYLQKWLKAKKQQTRGGGNSVGADGQSGFFKKTPGQQTADTSLKQTYDRFNAAIKAHQLNGPSSAEDYFQQLKKKFPGTPYTLDAKSTLAAAYIDVAQARVDRYLGCSDEGSAKEKQANYEAAVNLEKAIASVREDDEDFAKSLYNRMYFLKACGDYGKDGKNGDIAEAFKNAYAALAIDRNGAYIQNKLALLHLANNQKDSALYYAGKAARTAPNWLCALSTLALVKKAADQPDQHQPENKTKTKTGIKNSVGGVLGGGISKMIPSFTPIRNSNIIGINPRNIVKADNGIIYQVGISKNFSIRPATVVSMEGGELVYDRQNITGGQIFHDTVKIKNTSIHVAVPLIIHFSNKKIAPFISLGPSFNYIISQDARSTELLPVKKSVFLGDAGLGVDITLGKSRLILSPELRYTQGFNNQKENAGTEFATVTSSLKQRGVTFSIYLRGK